MFVPGPQCTTAEGCTGTTKYSQNGENQNKTTSVTYGLGSIEGEDFKDTFSIASLTVPDQGFISLEKASGFSSSNAEGLLGMGPSTIAQTGYALYGEPDCREKVVADKFSFFPGRAKSQTQNRPELTLGGALYGHS